MNEEELIGKIKVLTSELLYHWRKAGSVERKAVILDAWCGGNWPPPDCSQEFDNAEYVETIVAGIAEEHAELEADAKRYRYLRGKLGNPGLWTLYGGGTDESIDAAIDKAIEAEA